MVRGGGCRPSKGLGVLGRCCCPRGWREVAKGLRRRRRARGGRGGGEVEGGRAVVGPKVLVKLRPSKGREGRVARSRERRSKLGSVRGGGWEEGVEVEEVEAAALRLTGVEEETGGGSWEVVEEAEEVEEVALCRVDCQRRKRGRQLPIGDEEGEGVWLGGGCGGDGGGEMLHGEEHRLQTGGQRTDQAWYSRYRVIMVAAPATEAEPASAAAERRRTAEDYSDRVQ